MVVDWPTAHPAAIAITPLVHRTLIVVPNYTTVNCATVTKSGKEGLCSLLGSIQEFCQVIKWMDEPIQTRDKRFHRFSSIDRDACTVLVSSYTTVTCIKYQVCGSVSQNTMR